MVTPGATAASSSSRISQTIRPASRISAISSALIATGTPFMSYLPSASTIDAKTCSGAPHAVDAASSPLGCVEGVQRRGRPSRTRPERASAPSSGVVVGRARSARCRTCRTLPPASAAFGGQVEDRAVTSGRTRRPRHALDEHRLGHLERDHRGRSSGPASWPASPPAPRPGRMVRGKPSKHAAARRSPAALSRSSTMRDHDRVGHAGCPPSIIGPDLLAQLGAPVDSALRKMSPVEICGTCRTLAHQLLGLGALPRSRGPKKDQVHRGPLTCCVRQSPCQSGRGCADRADRRSPRSCG